MSNDDVQVSIAKDNGYKTQWAKGLFYRKEGDKYVFKTEFAKYGAIAFFIVTTIIILFQDTPNIAKEEEQAIDSPDRISAQQPQIELETYKEEKETKVVKKSKPVKIERLSLISRQEKVKIPLGTTAKAILKTGGTNGPIKAVLLEDVEFNGEIYITEGSTIWGVGSSTDERLIVHFSKYVTRDGVSRKISASAYDKSDQILGLKGSIIGRTSKKLLAGAGLGVAGALQTLQERKNMGGIEVAEPTMGNALLNGASNAALGMAETELEELKNKQTIIEVPKDTEIIVVFGEI